MKCEVKLYVAGTVFTETVQARDYQEARQVALARNQMPQLWVSMRLLNKALTIWKYALGSFSDDRTKEYDNYVVVVRTVIFVEASYH